MTAMSQNKFYASLEINANAPIDGRLYVNTVAELVDLPYKFANMIVFVKSEKTMYYLQDGVDGSSIGHWVSQAVILNDGQGTSWNNTAQAYDIGGTVAQAFPEILFADDGFGTGMFIGSADYQIGLTIDPYFGGYPISLTANNAGVLINTNQVLLGFDQTYGRFNFNKNAGFEQVIFEQANGQYGALMYADNYSANFTERSLIDKGYIDALLDPPVGTIVALEPVLASGTTPPVSPTIGDRYRVASNSTGAWSGHETEIAQWNGASWDFTIPVADNTVLVLANGRTLRFTGADWVNYGGQFLVNGGNWIGQGTQYLTVGAQYPTNNIRFKLGWNNYPVEILSNGTINYQSNVHGNYTLRSLVDKEYIDTLFTDGQGTTYNSAAKSFDLGNTYSADVDIFSDSNYFGIYGTNNGFFYDPIFSPSTSALTIYSSVPNQTYGAVFNVGYSNTDLSLYTNGSDRIGLILNSITGFQVVDTSFNKGLFYAADHTANYVELSLIHKEYSDTRDYVNKEFEFSVGGIGTVFTQLRHGQIIDTDTVEFDTTVITSIEYSVRPNSATSNGSWDILTNLSQLNSYINGTYSAPINGLLGIGEYFQLRLRPTFNGSWNGRGHFSFAHKPIKQLL